MSMNYTVSANTSSVYTAKLVDENDNPVGVSALSSLTLTVRARVYSSNNGVGPIVNSRDVQNVLNTNGITVDEGGNIRWEMSADDNQIVVPGLRTEIHVCVLRWAWGSPTKYGQHTFNVKVH